MNSIDTVVIISDSNAIDGGISKVAYDTAKLLTENCLKVYWFSAENKVKENEKLPNINYISSNQFATLNDPNRIRGLVNGIYNLKAKQELEKLLDTLDKQTTIVHIQGWVKVLSSSIFIAIQNKGFKFIVTFHDYFLPCPNGGFFNYPKNELCNLKAFSAKCIFCNCDSRSYTVKIYRLIRHFIQNKVINLPKRIKNIISISEFSQNLWQPYIDKNAKIFRINNPVDVEKRTERIKAEENDYYLFVGRISREKGCDLFCKAILELGLKGIVVGDGEQKNILEKKFPNIKFEGWKSKEEVGKYMENAKCLVFPSVWAETFGLVVLEALCMGLPVISSDSGAQKEFIENDITGFTFENKNIKQLKNAIKKIQDNKICEKYSKNAFEKYENTDFNKKYIENILEAYAAIT